MLRTITALLAMAACTVGFAQQTTAPIYAPSATANIDREAPVYHNTPNGHFRNVWEVPLASSGNAFTVLASEVHSVAANEELSTVVFVHRNNPGDNGGFTSQYRFDISTDKGATWDLDIGILNANTSDTSQGFHSRFPNAAIYNPAGNTDPDSAYLVFLGSYHNGDNWEGFSAGVARLDGDASTIKDKDVKVFNGNVGVANSLTQSVSGKFWAVTTYTDATFDSTFTDGRIPRGIVLLKGQWNPATKEVDWTADSLGINLMFGGSDTGRIASPNIAFDPSGKFGFISFTGKVMPGGSKAYRPCFMASTDSGQTWSAPQQIDISLIPAMQNTMDVAGGDSITAGFETDLFVDALGQPHLLMPTSSLFQGGPYSYTIGPGAPHSLFLLSLDASGPSYDAFLVDTLVTGSTGPLADVGHGWRPQISHNLSADKMLLTWSDTDPSLVTASPFPNNQPDYRGRAFNATTRAFMGGRIDYTVDDQAYAQLAMFPTVAPLSFVDETQANNWWAPTVIIEPQTGSGAQPVDFVYFKDVSWPAPRIVTSAPTADMTTFELYPNPTSGNVQLNLSALQGDIVVEVFNANGQLISSTNAINSQLTIPSSAYANGVYTVRTHSNAGVSSARLIVAR